MLVCETPHVIPWSMTTRGSGGSRCSCPGGIGGARTRRVPSAARMVGVGDRDMVSCTRAGIAVLPRALGAAAGMIAPVLADVAVASARRLLERQYRTRPPRNLAARTSCPDGRRCPPHAPVPRPGRLPGHGGRTAAADPHLEYLRVGGERVRPAGNLGAAAAGSCSRPRSVPPAALAGGIGRTTRGTHAAAIPGAPPWLGQMFLAGQKPPDAGAVYPLPAYPASSVLIMRARAFRAWLVISSLN
jgi:hypothetical protein